MLLLSFNISDDKYVIDTRNVIEVTTLVKLKKIPMSMIGVAGLLNYHGTAVPIIDINELCDKPSQKSSLTTRLIIVNYLENNILGIKAQNVTETIRINENAFIKSGIKINNSDFIGDVAEIDNRFIQLINIDQLLTNDIRKCLFSNDSKAVGL